MLVPRSPLLQPLFFHDRSVPDAPTVINTVTEVRFDRERMHIVFDGCKQINWDLARLSPNLKSIRFVGCELRFGANFSLPPCCTMCRLEKCITPKSFPKALQRHNTWKEMILVDIRCLEQLPNLSQWLDLKHLHLEKCNLTNLPTSIQYLKNLEKLVLNMLKLTALPKSITQLRLRSLEIANTGPNLALEDSQLTWCRSIPDTTFPEALPSKKAKTHAT